MATTGVLCTGFGRPIIASACAVLLMWTFSDRFGTSDSLPAAALIAGSDSLPILRLPHDSTAGAQGLRFVECRPGLCACFAPGTPQDYIEEFEALMSPNIAYSGYGRWSFTATNGGTGSNGDPITLAYSFVPDYDTGDPTTSNTLHATLDAKFGSRSAWTDLFADIFADWSVLTGIEYVLVSDDGAAWPDSAGQAGVRGDVRIVAFAVDGVNNVLAYNYYPDTGDLALDSAEDWANAADDYRFMRNIIMHELGHGMGLQHVIPLDNTKLMEAFLNTSFAGPQDDDVRGAVFYYGDAYEPNDSSGTATGLGTLSSNATVSGHGLHDAGDADWFSLGVSGSRLVNVTVTPLGSSYSVGPDGGSASAIDTRAINRVRVQLYDAAGTTLLATATAATAGQAATTPAVVSGSGTTTYKIRVSAAGSTTDVQRYSLSLGLAVPGPLNVQSTPVTGVSIAVSPSDNDGATHGNTNFSRNYSSGASVQLTAPVASGSYAFQGWNVNGVDRPAGQQAISVSISGAPTVAIARYADPSALSVDAGDDQTISAGSAAQLSATVSGGLQPYSYLWSPPQGLSSAAASNPIATPGSTTTYTLLVTDSSGRTASDSVAVNVIQPLVAEAGVDLTVGAGESFSLSGGAAGGVAPYLYSWSPAEPLDTPTSRTASGQVEETAVFTLTVSDSAGNTATDSVQVSVSAPLVVDAGDDVTIAAGKSATLTATASGGTQPYSFQWSPAGSTLSGDGSSVRVTPSGTATYTVMVRDAAGEQALDAVAVTVLNLAPLAVSVSGSHVIAPGESVLLEASVAGGLQPYSYRWSPADGLSNADVLQPHASPGVTTEYVLTVTDSLEQRAEAKAVVEVALVSSDNVEGDQASSGGETGSPPLCGQGILIVLPLTLASLLSLRREWRT